MSQVPVFDQNHYDALNRARAVFLDRFLPEWKRQFAMKNAIDVGCGFGYFSAFLAVQGFEVVAIDGREQNISEARRRYEGIDFQLFDAEQPSLAGLGSFDLVLCFGLLYHLENPFRAIRNLFSLTRQVLVLESVSIPSQAVAMELLDESTLDDQGLNYVAFYPSEACLVKMLYRAGFRQVYSFSEHPQHADFQSNRNRHRYRTMLVASTVEMRHVLLRHYPEPKETEDLWTTCFWRTKHAIRERMRALRHRFTPRTARLYRNSK